MTEPGAGPGTARSGDAPATVCGIVLAGGRSRRMGRDKAALPWAESTMLGTVVATQRAVLAHVIVVAARGQQLPEVDAEIVRDPVPDEGPLRGLATGLAAAAAGGYEWAFAAATDTPLLTERAIREVLAADPRADVVVAVAGGRDQPLIARYRTGLLADLEAALAAGERRMGVLLDQTPGRRVHRVVLGDEAAAFNVNTPADARHASRSLGSGLPLNP